MPAHGTASSRGLGTAGRKLWDSATTEFELETHELGLLLQLCRTADLLEDLQKQIDRDGLMQRVCFEDSGKQSASRLHPALAEIRQQRLVYAKLFSALGLPQGLADGLAPAAEDKPKPKRQRKTRFQVVRDTGTPGMS